MSYKILKSSFCLLPFLSRVLLAELEAHQDAWPFLTPVNLKAVPGYRKIIKKPMDFSTIREKLTNNQYVCVTVTALLFLRRCMHVFHVDFMCIFYIV